MKIVTDCAADMPADELHALEVAQVPLYIQFPEGEVSSADLTADQFYDRLAAMHPAIPSTSMPGSALFSELYRGVAATDPRILSLHISSGLSGTLNVAKISAEEVSPHPEVHVWDTMTLSGGQRFQVLVAAWAVRAGWTLEAIQERLAAVRQRTEVVYTLETLEYLARGGRIGRVQALAGALLKIKPVIHVDHQDGKYSTVAKGRTISQALSTIVNHLHGLYADTPLWATVLHGRFADQADALASELQSRLNVARLEVMRISPVLGVHTGPGIVGAAAVPLELVEDLLPTT
jgi:DegV family protein with EDD domain